MHQIQRLIILSLFVLPTLAKTVVAISDNQIDTNHIDLREHLYTNISEYKNGRDSDGNGKIDDLHGWSFVHDEAFIFDDSLLNSFDPRVYEYYEIRKKKTLKTASEEELKWYSDIRKDDKFMDSRSDFSSYTHGSHVTCIAMETQKIPREMTRNDLQFLPIRYLGDDAKGLFKKTEYKASNKKYQTGKINHIRKYMRNYENWMIEKFKTTVEYSSKTARIYHASWGQSWEPSYNMINELFQEEFNLKEKEVDAKFKIQIENMRKQVMLNIIRRGKLVIQRYPQMLFVFSAGNKKDNTDEALHYPSSIVADNVISVGAIDEHEKEKAYFSNFGKETVTIFAPGVAINSCSPGDRYIPINGTSQAAPHITNTAAIIFSMADYYAKAITPAQVKRILINSGTKLESLKDYSQSSAKLNKTRAIELARKILR